MAAEDDGGPAAELIARAAVGPLVPRYGAGAGDLVISIAAAELKDVEWAVVPLTAAPPRAPTTPPPPVPPEVVLPAGLSPLVAEAALVEARKAAAAALAPAALIPTRAGPLSHPLVRVAAAPGTAPDTEDACVAVNGVVVTTGNAALLVAAIGGRLATTAQPAPQLPAPPPDCRMLQLAFRPRYRAVSLAADIAAGRATSGPTVSRMGGAWGGGARLDHPSSAPPSLRHRGAPSLPCVRAAACPQPHLAARSRRETPVPAGQRFAVSAARTNARRMISRV
jgi:hypothetical protein